jgi:hypothetical protein
MAAHAWDRAAHRVVVELSEAVVSDERTRAMQGKWWAVYGAMVALQVRDHLELHRMPPPTHEDMRRYVEHAREIADMAMEVDV